MSGVEARAMDIKVPPVGLQAYKKSDQVKIREASIRCRNSFQQVEFFWTRRWRHLSQTFLDRRRRGFDQFPRRSCWILNDLNKKTFLHIRRVAGDNNGRALAFLWRTDTTEWIRHQTSGMQWDWGTYSEERSWANCSFTILQVGK